MVTSPPGIAAPGRMRSIRGMPFVSKSILESGVVAHLFRGEVSSLMPKKTPASNVFVQGRRRGLPQILNSNSPGDPQPQRRVNSRNPIVRHDSQAAGERFGLPRGKGLPNIEYPKKNKAQKQIFPLGRQPHPYPYPLPPPTHHLH